MSKAHGGNSRTAQRRRKRAAVLSQQMRHGDGAAALSLLKRGHALKGIAMRGWGWRLRLAVQARLAKCKLRREERAAGAQVLAAQHAALEERGERKTREQVAVMERAHKQALKELEARLQRQRPVRS
jgi:hypothetical protein